MSARLYTNQRMAIKTVMLFEEICGVYEILMEGEYFDNFKSLMLSVDDKMDIVKYPDINILFKEYIIRDYLTLINQPDKLKKKVIYTLSENLSF
jgi:hypothetical protein